MYRPTNYIEEFTVLYFLNALHVLADLVADDTPSALTSHFGERRGNTNQVRTYVRNEIAKLFDSSKNGYVRT